MKLALNAWEFLTTHGFKETFVYARYWVSEKLHERHYGILTQKEVDMASLGYDSQYVPHDPSPYRALKTIFQALPFREGDVLIDYGSGAGRSSLVAARMYPFKRVIGVELLPSLVSLAERNLRQVRLELACKDVRFLQADAMAYTLPPDATIAFLFNPFTGEVLRQVLDNILTSLVTAPRPFLIAILNPSDFERPSWMKWMTTVRTYPYDCEIYRAEVTLETAEGGNVEEASSA
jgi:trans-aconitate methyltransferase